MQLLMIQLLKKSNKRIMCWQSINLWYFVRSLGLWSWILYQGVIYYNFLRKTHNPIKKWILNSLWICSLRSATRFTVKKRSLNKLRKVNNFSNYYYFYKSIISRCFDKKCRNSISHIAQSKHQITKARTNFLRITNLNILMKIKNLPMSIWIRNSLQKRLIVRNWENRIHQSKN